jgi:energy-dependent translational throttle protein EttA
VDPAGRQGERGRAEATRHTHAGCSSRARRRSSHETVCAAALALSTPRRPPLPLQGRQTKSKSRVAAFDAMVADREAARSSEKFLSGQIVIPPGPRLGDLVVDVRGLTHALDDGRALFRGVSFKVPKGAIVGVIGGNGAGKSTLLRFIAGDAAPQGGSVTVGSTVRMSLVSQMRAELGGNERVIDVVGAGSDYVPVGDFEMPIRQYLAGFNIVGELQTKLVRSLSGGERNRVHLARALRTPCNLLMLDEPTNDLDVDTLRSLEEALSDDFLGSAIIVSHDRYFIDRVATHLLVFRGGGDVEWFEGNFTDYEAACAERGLPPPGVAVAQGGGESKPVMPQIPMR